MQTFFKTQMGLQMVTHEAQTFRMEPSMRIYIGKWTSSECSGILQFAGHAEFACQYTIRKVRTNTFFQVVVVVWYVWLDEAFNTSNMDSSEQFLRDSSSCPIYGYPVSIMLPRW